MVVIETDHPRIDPSRLNKAVIDDRIAKFRQAVRRDFNDETAHYGLGVAYFNLGLLDDAARELTEAARLMPENPNIQHQLAVVYAEMAKAGHTGAEASAWDRLNRTLLLTTAAADPFLLKAELHLRKGQRKEAIDAWRKAFQADADSIRQPIASFLNSNREIILVTDRIKSIPKFEDHYGSRAAQIGIAAFFVLAALAMIRGGLSTTHHDSWSNIVELAGLAAFLVMIAGPILLVSKGQDAKKAHREKWSTYVSPEVQQILSGKIGDPSRMLEAAAFVDSELAKREQAQFEQEQVRQRNAERMATLRGPSPSPQSTLSRPRKRRKSGCSGCGLILVLTTSAALLVGSLALL
jgi:tetratricopeptide (TPR) repeat protein